jgi:phosphatidylglycerol:prolipoprotein diacylglycerol transferase
MVHINIDPILLQWGSFSISWHGLFHAAGASVIYLLVVRIGTREGFTRQSLSKLAFWAVFSGLIGARLVHVGGNWNFYRTAPHKIFFIHEGGLTVNGAILGVFICTVVYARWKQLDLWKLVDVLAIAAPIAFIVGRIGCTINGDVWGLPTNSSWGLVYWHPNSFVPPELLGVPTFPAPILHQLWNIGLLLLLLTLRKRLPGDGILFVIYLVFYALGRFVVNIWQPGEVLILGLKFFQIVALLFMLLGLALIFYLRRRHQSILIGQLR